MVKITTFTAKIAVLFSVLILSSTMVNAQAVNEVTLTVSGDGATKTEATAMALRSAIEQAFGTFVSANTTILNDELVRDEIATVSSGNIKNYEEIVSALLPNGNTTVTLKATVSVSKLISYAQSKGSSAEFAGQTFAMNMKLKELNKENEEKAMENLKIQLNELSPYIFDYEISNIKDPVLTNADNVFPSLPITARMAKLRRDGITDNEFYIINAEVLITSNDNTETYNHLLLSTLQSISLNDAEYNDYRQTRLPIWVIEHGTTKFHLRSEQSILVLRDIIANITQIYKTGFKIIDNNQIEYHNMKDDLPQQRTSTESDNRPLPYISDVIEPASNMSMAHRAANPDLRIIKFSIPHLNNRQSQTTRQKRGKQNGGSTSPFIRKKEIGIGVGKEQIRNIASFEVVSAQ